MLPPCNVEGEGELHIAPVLPKLNTFLELSLEIAYRGDLHTTQNLQIQYIIIIHLGSQKYLTHVGFLSYSLHLPANYLRQFPKI